MRKTSNFIQFILAGVLVFPTACCALGQNATVTFYTPGSVLKERAKGLVKLSGEFAFRGDLFVDDQKLARIRPDRFLSIQLAPGPHKMYAMSTQQTTNKEVLAMQLEPGNHYCVRLRTQFKQYFFYIDLTGRMTPVNCAVGRAENGTGIAVPPKHVDAASRNLLVPPAGAF